MGASPLRLARDDGERCDGGVRARHEQRARVDRRLMQSCNGSGSTSTRSGSPLQPAACCSSWTQCQASRSFRIDVERDAVDLLTAQARNAGTHRPATTSSTSPSTLVYGSRGVATSPSIRRTTGWPAYFADPTSTPLRRTSFRVARASRPATANYPGAAASQRRSRSSLSWRTTRQGQALALSARLRDEIEALGTSWSPFPRRVGDHDVPLVTGTWRTTSGCWRSCSTSGSSSRSLRVGPRRHPRVDALLQRRVRRRLRLGVTLRRGASLDRGLIDHAVVL